MFETVIKLKNRIYNDILLKCHIIKIWANLSICSFPFLSHERILERIPGFCLHLYQIDDISFLLDDICSDEHIILEEGVIKIHTLYDVEAQVPAFFHITTASVHDSQAMKEIPVKTGSYYIFDRA